MGISKTTSISMSKPTLLHILCSHTPIHAFNFLSYHIVPYDDICHVMSICVSRHVYAMSCDAISHVTPFMSHHSCHVDSRHATHAMSGHAVALHTWPHFQHVGSLAAHSQPVPSLERAAFIGRLGGPFHAGRHDTANGRGLRC